MSVFALSWLVIVVRLTLASLRLPMAFTVLFALIDLALLLVFLFTGLGIYLFLDAMGVATGGKPLPLGKPLLK
ncbi:hypothetical protein ACTXG6_19595 [Pseudonocardia sp. Cha107L01]|uniref:hypothetical protein n=1 Tax=Pseudonocardia sp. Cha107L01 TaxID=3457576 RepID=UPI00403E7827